MKVYRAFFIFFLAYAYHTVAQEAESTTGPSCSYADFEIQATSLDQCEKKLVEVSKQLENTSMQLSIAKDNAKSAAAESNRLLIESEMKASSLVAELSTMIDKLATASEINSDLEDKLQNIGTCPDQLRSLDEQRSELLLTHEAVVAAHASLDRDLKSTKEALNAAVSSRDAFHSELLGLQNKISEVEAERATYQAEKDSMSKLLLATISKLEKATDDLSQAYDSGKVFDEWKKRVMLLISEIYKTYFVPMSTAYIQPVTSKVGAIISLLYSTLIYPYKDWGTFIMDLSQKAWILCKDEGPAIIEEVWFQINLYLYFFTTRSLDTLDNTVDYFLDSVYPQLQLLFHSTVDAVKAIPQVDSVFGEKTDHVVFAIFTIVGVTVSYLLRKPIAIVTMAPIALVLYPILWTILTICRSIAHFGVSNILSLPLAIPAYAAFCLVASITDVVAYFLYIFTCGFLDRRRKPIVFTMNKRKEQVVKEKKQSSSCSNPDVVAALDYLKHVKKTFRKKPDVYQEFILLMNDVAYKNQNASAAVTKIRKLFKGHNDLLDGLAIYIQNTGGEGPVENDSSSMQ